MAGKRTKPAADVPSAETVERPPVDVSAIRATDAPVETAAAAGGYETKVVVPEIRNRVLDIQGNVVAPPVGHVHAWERGRRPDGSQIYHCACGEEKAR